MALQAPTLVGDGPGEGNGTGGGGNGANLRGGRGNYEIQTVVGGVVLDIRDDTGRNDGLETAEGIALVAAIFKERIPPDGEMTEKTDEDSRSNRRPIELIGSPACQRSQISAR